MFTRLAILCFLLSFSLGANELSFPTGTGLPSGGYFDSYHPSLGEWPLDGQGGEGSEALLKTAMALRVMKTEELLQARQAYLELLHPEDENAPYKKVPDGVRETFVNGQKIVQISFLIEQLEHGTERLDEDRIKDRKKLFETLSLLSINLSQIDRLIKFFSEEIFKGNKSFKKMVQKLSRQLSQTRGRGDYLGNGVSGRSAFSSQAKKSVEQYLWNKLGIGEILENLLAQRTFLLNRYPLMGVEIDDCKELYRCVYKKLRKTLKLPGLTNRMKLGDEVDLATVTKIDVSEGDQRRVEKNLQMFAENREKALEKVTPVFDEGIKKALHGNFEFLKELNRETYFWDNTTPYFLIALDESNWKKLIEGDGFFWVPREVFQQGKEEMIALVEEEGRKNEFRGKILSYLSWGLVGGAFLVWIPGWAGVTMMASAKVIGHGAFLASGITYGIKVALDRINSKRYNELANNLYIGSYEDSYYGIREDYRLMAKQSYKEVAYVVSSFLLFGRGPIMALRRFYRSPLKVVRGQKTVAVPSQRVGALQEKVKSFQGSFLSRFSFFGKLLEEAKGVLRFGETWRVKKGLTDVVKKNATRAGTTPSSLRAKITSSPVFERAMKKIIIPTSENLMNSFVRREILVEFLAALASEIVVRRDKFLEEFQYALINIMFSMGVVYKISSQTYRNSILGVGKEPKIYPKVGEAFSLRTFFVNWGKNTKELGISTLWLAVVLSGFNVIIDMDEGGFTEEELAKFGELLFWMIGFTAIVSPPRSQFVSARINPAIDRLYKRRFPSLEGSMLIRRWADDVKIPVSIGNNMAGCIGMTYILRERGLQSSETNYFDNMTYIYNKPNDHNSQYLFPVILGGQLEGFLGRPFLLRPCNFFKSH